MIEKLWIHICKKPFEQKPQEQKSSEKQSCMWHCSFIEYIKMSSYRKLNNNLLTYFANYKNIYTCLNLYNKFINWIISILRHVLKTNFYNYMQNVKQV